MDDGEFGVHAYSQAPELMRSEPFLIHGWFIVLVRFLEFV